MLIPADINLKEVLCTRFSACGRHIKVCWTCRWQKTYDLQRCNTWI